MWVRLRLDIGWDDLWFAFRQTFRRRSAALLQQQLERYWSAENEDALACLSVRSGFDLLLTALELPPGTEILFSAVTISDMPDIARAHDFTPVPVDILEPDGRLEINALLAAISPQSRVLVVSHLFGARPDLSEISQIARQHQLLLVEDCAQAWFDPQWRGNNLAEISLFSFGTIKTATALGGALCRIADSRLQQKMRSLQAQYPLQNGRKYRSKIVKSALLKLLSLRIFAICLMQICRGTGQDIDALFSNLTRGFGEGELLTQIRIRPGHALLALLLLRLRTYSSQRLEIRRRNGLRLLRLLDAAPATCPHTYWLFPFMAFEVQQLRTKLLQQGFDTSRAGRLRVIRKPDNDHHHPCPRATAFLKQVIFLPCYAELPPRDLDRLGHLIRSFTGVEAARTSCSGLSPRSTFRLTKDDSPSGGTQPMRE